MLTDQKDANLGHRLLRLKSLALVVVKFTSKSVLEHIDGLEVLAVNGEVEKIRGAFRWRQLSKFRRRRIVMEDALDHNLQKKVGKFYKIKTYRRKMNDTVEISVVFATSTGCNASRLKNKIHNYQVYNQC
jgi:hypothetical protein